MSLLALDGLSVRLAQREVLRDVSLSVSGGEFVGLIGPNGAGKTTLLRAALQLTGAEGGISLGGRDARRLTALERAQLAAYLAQDRDIAWDVPVEMVVGLGRSAYTASPRDAAVVEAAMQRMDVARLRHRPATALSGGEKARVLIARALAQDTPLLLADEPTAGLDPAHQIAVMRLFAQLAGQGRGVVASLHDLSLAARWCSRLVVLDAGRVVADGKPAAVLTDELLHDLYGVAVYRGVAAGAPVIQPIDILEARPDD